MKKIYLTLLGFFVLLPAVLIYYFVGNSKPKRETDFIDDHCIAEAVVSKRILYSEEVILVDLYSTIYVLKDGREAEVQIWDQFAPEIFQKGKKVILYYSTSEGMRIIDPISRVYRQVSIMRDQSKHPFHLIDLIYLKLCEVYNTPVDEARAFYEATSLWQCEIQRMEKLLLTAKNVTPEIQEEVRLMQKHRTEYLNRYYELTCHIREYGMPRGNGHWEYMDSREYNYRAYRDFAIQLCIMGQYLNNYNHPDAGEQYKLLDGRDALEKAKVKKVQSN